MSCINSNITQKYAPSEKLSHQELSEIGKTISAGFIAYCIKLILNTFSFVSFINIRINNYFENKAVQEISRYNHQFVKDNFPNSSNEVAIETILNANTTTIIAKKNVLYREIKKICKPFPVQNNLPNETNQEPTGLLQKDLIESKIDATNEHIQPPKSELERPIEHQVEPIVANFVEPLPLPRIEAPVEFLHEQIEDAKMGPPVVQEVEAPVEAPQKEIDEDEINPQPEEPEIEALVETSQKQITEPEIAQPAELAPEGPLKALNEDEAELIELMGYFEKLEAENVNQLSENFEVLDGKNKKKITSLDKFCTSLDEKFITVLTPFILEVAKKHLPEKEILQLKQSLEVLSIFDTMSGPPKGWLDKFNKNSKDNINTLIELIKTEDSDKKLNVIEEAFKEIINQVIDNKYVKEKSDYFKTNFTTLSRATSSTLIQTAFSAYVPNFIKVTAVSYAVNEELDEYTYQTPELEADIRKHAMNVVKILVPILDKIDAEYNVQKIYNLNEKIIDRIAAITPSNEEAGIKDIKKMSTEMCKQILTSFHRPINKFLNACCS